jgi:hypothetical protein
MAQKSTTAVAGARAIKTPQAPVTAAPKPTTGQLWPRGSKRGS